MASGADDDAELRGWNAGDEPHLRALRAVVESMAALRRLEVALVVRLRQDGATWREIADALGVRLQSAHRRFRDVDPTPRGRDPLLAEIQAFHDALKGSGPVSER